MFTLALDCSTSQGSVAFGRSSEGVDGGIELLWERVFPAGRGHGGELFATLEEAINTVATNEDGSERGRLERIVVGLGPGSYSGVRQSIAVATGLSLSTGAVLAGVPSTLALGTDAVAYQAIGDARRGTFYYTAVANGRLVEGPDLLDDLDALLARLARHPDWPVLAVEAVPAVLAARPDTFAALPLATRLLGISPASQDSGILEPIYLRPVSVTMPKAKAAEKQKAEGGR